MSIRVSAGEPGTGPPVLHAGPDYHGLDAVARWIFDEWGHLRRGNSLAATRARIEGRLRGVLVPSLHVIEVDGAPAATASLVECDLTLRPELTPWLASVYVAPAFRRRGLASRLVSHLAARAAGSGIETLYLITTDQQALYARHGWREREVLAYRGEEVTVMAREL